jgi:hypothetical protein
MEVIAMEIYEFLKDVEEINRSREIALRYAASILEDFRDLTPKGRKVMADTLMELISGEIRLKNFQYQRFPN